MSTEFDPAAYGRIWAADYDGLFEHRDDIDTVTSFLVGLAPTGAVLDMGVGTGRLAIPLAAAGYAVTGVDASSDMLEKLRGRPGAEQVDTLEGDFTSIDAGSRFDLVVIAFSTLFLVPSQELQLACLANAHRHLRPGGRAVIEAFVPDHSRWTRGQNLSIGRLEPDRVTLKLSTHDPVQQLITTQDVLIRPDGATMRPNLLRYVWPAELDAMALASQLILVKRLADWTGAAFGAESTSHVSVYRRAEDPP